MVTQKLILNTKKKTHSHKELVYFTGDVHEERMAELKIRHREKFQLEIRDSNVLVLSVKAKSDLNLQEALEIVGKSDLKAYMSKIELVAVIPASVRAKRAATISHAYVQFVDNATARECINIVDSMEYNGYRVHSPQLDAASFVKCDFGASIWHNPALTLPFAPTIQTSSLNSEPTTASTSPVSSTSPHSVVYAQNTMPFMLSQAQMSPVLPQMAPLQLPMPVQAVQGQTPLSQRAVGGLSVLPGGVQTVQGVQGVAQQVQQVQQMQAPLQQMMLLQQSQLQQLQQQQQQLQQQQHNYLQQVLVPVMLMPQQQQQQLVQPVYMVHTPPGSSAGSSV